MSDVPISIVRAAVAVSERYGIPRAELLGAPSVEEHALRRRTRRVSWDAFCEFNDRVERAWRSRGGLERFGRAYNEQAPPELASIARAVIPPRQFLRLLFALGAWAHPFATVEVREKRRDELALIITLDPARRDNPSFLRICAATMGWATTLIGLPPCQVELSLAPRQGTFTFKVPPSKTLFHRAQTAIDQRALAMLRRIEELQAEVRELHAARRPRADSAAQERAQELARRWSLSPRQAEVLRWLASGASNREIARALDLAERTVEVHVSALLRRAGVDGRARLVAEFWAGPIATPGT